MNNTLLGICFALSAALMLSTMNVVAKLLGQYIGPIEITFYRNVVSIILLIGLIFIIKKIHLLKTKRIWAHIIRTAIGTTGMILIMWSFILMPLATATSLHFTAPLFVTLLSYPLLKEKVGLFRFIFVFIGFAGVLIIAQPENEISTLSLIVGLTAGFMNGLVAICLRWLGSTESTLTTNFYFLFIGLIGTSLFMPFIGSSPNIDIAPLVFLIGVVGLASLLLKTQSFRLAPAALISPISYTMMVWAILFDYFIWDSIPSTSLILGVSIIITSNLIITWREALKNKTPEAPKT